MPLGSVAARWVARYLSETRGRLVKGRTVPVLFVNHRGRTLGADGRSGESCGDTR